MAATNPDRRQFLWMGASVAAALGSALVAAAAAEQTAGGAPLKIGIIGAGREGGALGTLLVKAGHPVMFSSRHPEALKGFVAGLGPLAAAGTVAQAVDFGDVVMIVVPYPAMQEVARDYGHALVKKAAIIDVSNPIARRDGADFVKSVEEQGGAGLATERMLPRAHIVRAFNAISYLKLPADAHRSGEPVGVPIAGNNREAIAIVADLIREMGFEPVLVGGLAMGKYLVPGTPLGGEHTPAEIRSIAGGLQ